MDEQRIGTADVGVVLEGHHRTRPRTPGLHRNGMRGGGNAEQVQDHQFAVVIPAPRQETGFGLPSLRQLAARAGEHPGEVDASVDRIGRPDDRGIRFEASPHREHAGEEQRRVDRRQLALPRARAGAHVHEMVEPAVLLRTSPGEERQRRPYARENLRSRDPAAFGRDAHARQAEADRRDAADVPEAALDDGPPLVPDLSRMIPVDASACSQKNRKLLRDRSSRNASSLSEIRPAGAGVRAVACSRAAGTAASSSSADAIVSAAARRVRVPRPKYVNESPIRNRLSHRHRE